MNSLVTHHKKMQADMFPPSITNTLRVLRVVLHVSFALLLAFAIIKFLGVDSAFATHFMWDSAATAPNTTPAGTMHRATGSHWMLTTVVLLLSTALGALYLVGTVYEKRSSAQGIALAQPRVKVWLALVLTGWAILVALTPEFAWVAFPLFFVVRHIVPGVWGWIILIAQASYVGFWLSRNAESPTIAVWVGPLTGALAASVMTWIYQQLIRVSQQQAEVIAELEHTRSALAASQHEAGRIAERERLAQNIHDTLAQGFSSIVLMTRSTRSALNRGETTLGLERLAVIEQTASENLQEAREFVGKLSNKIGPFDILAALHTVVDSYNRTAKAADSNLTYTLRSEDSTIPVPAHIGEELVPAVRSLLANVLSHANATNCVVTVTTFPHQLAIDIYDNGSGFNPWKLDVDSRTDGSGFGLSSVTSRLETLGGKMFIESSQEVGTAVSLQVPLVSATPNNGTTQ